MLCPPHHMWLAGSVYSIYILKLLHINNLHLVLQLTVSAATPLIPLHAIVMYEVTLPFYIIIIIIIICVRLCLERC